jgi:uncharacterized protein YkwD
MRNFPGHRVARIAPLVVLCLLLAAPPAGATTETERAVHALVNEAREEVGRRVVGLSDRLSRIARQHSRAMADRQTLFHSCLTCRIGGNWRRLAENVGYGGSLEIVHRAFMDSAPHRSNILGRGFRQLGVGVVRAGGRLWVTQIFYG